MLELNFQPFPVIETERLLLREITDADIDMLFCLRSDKTVMKYVDRPLAVTKEDVMPLYNKTVAGVAENTGISWVIGLRETAEMIGQIGFWRIDTENHRAEIGYMLRPEFFGKGFGSEALKAVLSHGFKHFRFHSVEANVSPGNDASKRLLEKAGFVQEAYFRENYYFDGNFLDSLIYSLLEIDMK